MLIHPSKPINDGNNDDKMLIHLDSPIKKTSTSNSLISF